MNRRFTGRHMTAILIAFFGVVILVNFFMARLATSTFGGVVVENSYVASQEFNRWLDQAEDSRGLGWEAQVDRNAAGQVTVALSGSPAGVVLTAEARHPLGRQPDTRLTFDNLGANRFVSQQVLPSGRWILRLEGSDGVRIWRHEENLR